MGRRDSKQAANVPEHLLEFASKPGVRRCMNCQADFLSADVARIRRCDECKANVGYSKDHTTSGPLTGESRP